MKCAKCESELDEVPMCFGANSPARLMVNEEEYDEKVIENADSCIVDDKYFFVRGHVEIPVKDTNEIFIWSVWVSLSEESFNHMGEYWEIKGREKNPPYFGWLMTSLACYPETQHLKASVQTMLVGEVPQITLEASEHLLSIEQHQAINKSRVYEIVHEIMHQ